LRLQAKPAFRRSSNKVRVPYQGALPDYRSIREAMSAQATHTKARALDSEMRGDWDAIFQVLAQPQ